MICKHKSGPEGYVQRMDWLERMSKRYTQVKCDNCGLWAIWKSAPQKGKQMSDSKGAAIRDKIERRFRKFADSEAAEFGVQYGMIRENEQPFTMDEAIDSILAILAQEVNEARIDENRIIWDLPRDKGMIYFEEHIQKRFKKLERLG